MALSCLINSVLPRSSMSSTHLGVDAGTAIVSGLGIRYCGFRSRKSHGVCLCAKNTFHFRRVDKEERASSGRDTLKTDGERNL